MTNIQLLKRFTWSILAICTFFYTPVQACENYVGNPIIEQFEAIDLPNSSTFNEIVEKLNDGKCMIVQVSSTSILKNGANERAFTTFSTGYLKKITSSTIKADRLQTSFSDRKFFQGQKTVENISLKVVNDSFKIMVNFQTWGNANVTLDDPIIVKGQNGYFATGRYFDGQKNMQYTIAIYEEVCLH